MAPGLPQGGIPQVPAQPGSPGGQLNRTPGQMPYPVPAAAQAIQGTAAFVQQIAQAKLAQREAAKSQFYENLSLLQQGIPIDRDKTLKLAKKAGLADYWQIEPPDEKEQQYQNAFAQMNAGQAAAQAGNQQGVVAPQGAQMPGGMMQPAPTSGLAGLPPQSQFVASPQTNAALSAGPGGPPPQPGFLSRLSQNLGFTQPQVSQASPMGQWLGKLAQAGQIGGGQTVGGTARANQMADLEHDFEVQFGLPLKKTTAQQQMQMMGILQKAAAGDPQATQIMTQVGSNWQIPLNTMEMMLQKANPGMPAQEVSKQAAQLYQWVTMGGKDYRMFMMNYAKDLAPNFGNNVYQAMQWLQDPQNTPGPAMSPQQFEQYMTGFKQWNDKYPTAQFLTAPLAASYITPGGDQYRDRLMSQLTARNQRGEPIFPNSDTMDWSLRGADVATRQGELAQTVTNQTNMLAMQKFMALREGDKDTFDKLWGATFGPEAKNVPIAQKQALMEMLAKNTQKYANATVDFGGQKIPIGNPMDVMQTMGLGTGYFASPTAWLLGGGPMLQPKSQALPMGGGGGGVVSPSAPAASPQAPMSFNLSPGGPAFSPQQITAQQALQKLRTIQPQERMAVVNSMKRMMSESEYQQLMQGMNRLEAYEAVSGQ